MKRIKIALPVMILLGGFLVCGTATYGQPEYTQKEKKACSFCHTSATPKEAKADNLNDAGKYYQDHKTLDGYKK
jgi:hypothetical protein